MKRLKSGLLVVLSLTLGAIVTAEPKTNPIQPALVQGNTQFALDLYGKLRGEEGNLFFSPYSISSALAMTYAGAREQTAEAMARTLHFKLDNAALHPAFAALIKEINGKDRDAKKRGYQLSTANALWAQQDYHFLPAFLQLCQDNYGAGVKVVDFARATEQARQIINAWVEKETYDKIKDLLQQGVLQSDTRLMLTNAIYFKGDWATQFKKDQTREETFHLSPSKTSKAPLMNQMNLFGYFETPEYQMLEMPYVGKELAMVVLLPRQVDGLADLEKTLTPENLPASLRKLTSQDVIVTMPRFKSTSQFQLKKTLSEMGMGVAFSDGADFSGMSKESLTIGDVIHKAFVEVNEEGTEAAAATAGVVRPTAIAINPKPTPVFRADHPFVFLIRDTRSGSILFMGRVTKP